MITPDNLADWIQRGLSLVGFLSMLAALTPTPTDNAVLAILRKLLDFAAMNWGHARNAPKDAAGPVADPVPLPERRPERPGKW